jgi:hypothetical protein
MWLESALQYERDVEMERIFLIEPLLQADDVLIVMANDSMLDWARKFVHGRVLVMDTTFGLDRLGYSLCALMTIDDQGKGLPVALSIMKWETTESFERILRSFDEAVNINRDASERIVPAAIMTDDSGAERVLRG